MTSSARSPHQFDWLGARPKLFARTSPVVTSDTTDIARGRAVVAPLTATPFTNVCPLTTFGKLSQQSPLQIDPGAPYPPKKSRVLSSPSIGRDADVATVSSFTTPNTVRMFARRVVKFTLSSAPSNRSAGRPFTAFGMRRDTAAPYD